MRLYNYLEDLLSITYDWEEYTFDIFEDVEKCNPDEDCWEEI